MNEIEKDFFTENFYNYQDLFLKDITIAEDFKEKNREEKIFTYIMRDTSGFYKIGRTINVISRFKEIKIGNPTLHIYAIITGDHEKELHHLFCNNKHIGEWYHLSDSDITVLTNKMKSWSHVINQLPTINSYLVEPKSDELNFRHIRNIQSVEVKEIKTKRRTVSVKDKTKVVTKSEEKKEENGTKTHKDNYDKVNIENIPLLEEYENMRTRIVNMCRLLMIFTIGDLIRNSRKIKSCCATMYKTRTAIRESLTQIYGIKIVI